MNDILTSILSGGACVAVIEGVREYLSWRRQRKSSQEDKAEEEAEKEEEKSEEAEKCKSEQLNRRIGSLEAQVGALVESQKYILYDRIRYLGQAFISEHEIDFDDRRILNDMHKSYHNGLGGNGDLDILMTEVNKLPLKTK